MSVSTHTTRSPRSSCRLFQSASPFPHVRAQLGEDLVVLAHRRTPSSRAISTVRSVEAESTTQQLVDQRDAVHERLADASDDQADRLLLVEGREAHADRQALPLLQVHQAMEVAELAGVERVLREPPVDDGRQGAALLERGIGRREAPRLGPQVLERPRGDGLSRLHHHHRGAGSGRHRLGQAPEQATPGAAPRRRFGRGPNDHQVVVGRLAQDGGPHGLRPRARAA